MSVLQQQDGQVSVFRHPVDLGFRLFVRIGFVTSVATDDVGDVEIGEPGLAVLQKGPPDRQHTIEAASPSGILTVSRTLGNNARVVGFVLAHPRR